VTAREEIREFRRYFKDPMAEAVAYVIGTSTRPFPTLKRDAVVERAMPPQLKKGEPDNGNYLIEGYVAVKDLSVVDKLAKALTKRCRLKIGDKESLEYVWRRFCAQSLMEAGKTCMMDPTLQLTHKLEFCAPYQTEAVQLALLEDPLKLAMLSMVSMQWKIHCEWSEDTLWRTIVERIFITKNGEALPLREKCYVKDEMMAGWDRSQKLPWKKCYSKLHLLKVSGRRTEWENADGALKTFQAREDYLMGFQISNVNATVDDKGKLSTAVSIDDPSHPWPRLARVDLGHFNANSRNFNAN